MIDYSYTHPSWHPILKNALDKMDSAYLNEISSDTNILPRFDQIFNAFKLPLDQTRFILFGESPYPRAESANGYAFWDAAVGDIWSEKGLSKAVNRATSLRNLMKMLLVSDALIPESDCSKTAISKINKSNFIKKLDDFFNKLLSNGFLLLNAMLVLRDCSKTKDAKHWQPFLQTLLSELQLRQPNIQLILFGKIAEQINQLPESTNFDKLVAEHPYNLSFIHNKNVQNFFKPFNLLSK